MTKKAGAILGGDSAPEAPVKTTPDPAPATSVKTQQAPVQAPRPAATASDKALRIDPATIPSIEQPDRKVYWLGVTPDAPFDNLSAGGFTFQRYEGVVSYDEKGKPEGRPMLGCMHRMSEEELTACLQGVARRTLRQRRYIYDVTDPRFRPLADDEPVGKFVFLVDVEGGLSHDFRSKIPPPLVRDEE